MAEERVQRRLAAILVADVVGYSRMMGTDEAGTLARLNALRGDLLDPKVAEYGGRIVKTTGDGSLVEFPSAVDAVQHAIDVQQALARRNADLAEGERIEIRMGINLSDVIVEGDDIFGDGVNVAARLEALAAPGGIVISGKVHDEVQAKLDLAYEDLGPQRVKNIAEPVRTYAVGDKREGSKSAAPPPLDDDKPSIAVLAFDNMSGDPEQEYFSDGIAEDIITDVSKISGMFVVARNSSFAYKGQAVDLTRVARELGVKYILEGSVRKAADRVRITAQLIDGASGGHIWAERYDRILDDIFAIQDEITRAIVDALKVELDLDEKDRMGGTPTASIEAYDLALRARDLLYRGARENIVEATKLYAKSIELDPDFITAHAELAIASYNAYLNRWESDPRVVA